MLSVELICDMPEVLWLIISMKLEYVYAIPLFTKVKVFLPVVEYVQKFWTPRLVAGVAPDPKYHCTLPLA